MQTIAVTFILKDKTEWFYDKLASMCDLEKYNYLQATGKDIGITAKVGSGQFRDRVELNGLMRKSPTVSCEIAPRRGYKLATFQFKG